MKDILCKIYPLNLVLDILTGIDEYKEIYLKGLEMAIETLTEREQKVIQYRYQYNMTLEEAGKEFDVTRERIRQIEAKALRKLRQPGRKSLMKAVSTRDMKELEHKYHVLETECIRLTNEIDLIKDGEYFEPIQNITQRQKITINELDLDISVRAYNCLRRANIMTLGEIADMTESELMKIRNIGKKTVEEIIKILDKYDLKLKECEDER